MILIQITNVDELVRRKKGPIASVIGPWLTDTNAEVEKVIIAQIKDAFIKEGVKADMVSIGGLELRHLNLAADFEDSTLDHEA